jgi:hypothetical protein
MAAHQALRSSQPGFQSSGQAKSFFSDIAASSLSSDRSQVRSTKGAPLLRRQSIDVLAFSVLDRF